MPRIGSREKSEGSVNGKRISRNNSVELKQNPNLVNNPRPQSNRGVNDKYKYLERNKSLERNRSIERMERPDSRKKIPYSYGIGRK